MKFFAQTVLIVLVLVRLGWYVAKDAKQATRDDRIVGYTTTMIVVAIEAALFYFAGAFSEILAF